MSVMWMLMASFLYLQMGMISLLLLPCISAQKWNKVFKLSFFRALGEQVDYYFYAILVGFVLCLAEPISELRKYPAKKEQHQDLDQELKNAAVFFRAQRNLYIIGFSLFLFIAIRRLINVLATQAKVAFYQEASATAKLVYVNIQEENITEVLRAIEMTCPFLKDVTFGEKKKGDGIRTSRMQWSDDAPPTSGLAFDSDAYQRLELALSKWPKIESITFIKVSADYIQTILNVFHEELKELSFTGCKLINLADLARCTQLQSLRISSTCSLKSYENIPDLSIDSFLPNLKSFSCKICLGAVSSLFEEKSTLKLLSMKCCHMDIQECIQRKWRSLEILHLQRCSGLVDTAMVSRLIDELVDLKELFLPCRLEYNDPDQIKSQILRKAFTKPTPVNIKYKFPRRANCLLGPLTAHSIHSSIDSEIDSDPHESMDELYHDSE